MKSRFVFLLACAILVSCKQPDVTFAEPQPLGVGEKTNIPDRYLGQYENPEDGSLLDVGRERIITSNLVEASMKISDIDSAQTLKSNMLTDLETNESVVVETRNDSIFWNVKVTDTVYAKARKDVLKKFKGHYFVNRYYDGLGWQVKKLYLSKNLATISDISVKEDFEKVRPLAQNNPDSLPFHQLKASRQQFRQSVKDNGFSDGAVFLRKRS